MITLSTNVVDQPVNRASVFYTAKRIISRRVELVPMSRKCWEPPRFFIANASVIVPMRMENTLCGGWVKYHWRACSRVLKDTNDWENKFSISLTVAEGARSECCIPHQMKWARADTEVRFNRNRHAQKQPSLYTMDVVWIKCPANSGRWACRTVSLWQAQGSKMYICFTPEQ